MEQQMLAGNRILRDDTIGLGGTVYPFSAIPRSVDDWRWHDGPQWRALVEAKRRYDPGNRLASRPDVIGRRSQ